MRSGAGRRGLDGVDERPQALGPNPGRVPRAVGLARREQISREIQSREYGDVQRVDRTGAGPDARHRVVDVARNPMQGGFIGLAQDAVLLATDANCYRALCQGSSALGLEAAVELIELGDQIIDAL